jgi:hypothetical protein
MFGPGHFGIVAASTTAKFTAHNHLDPTRTDIVRHLPENERDFEILLEKFQ